MNLGSVYSSFIQSFHTNHKKDPMAHSRSGQKEARAWLGFGQCLVGLTEPFSSLPMASMGYQGEGCYSSGCKVRIEKGGI